MKGLIIKQPWIDLILSGKKDWEIRGSNATYRGNIKLIQQGTGHIVGEADLVAVLPLGIDDFAKETKHHCVENVEAIGNYRRIYAWVLQNVKKYDMPISYNHPNGAVIWVNLPDSI